MIPFVESGVPVTPGVYVIWTNDDLIKTWAKRMFAFWDGKHWSHMGSDQRMRDHVYAWAGPLPALPLTDSDDTDV